MKPETERWVRRAEEDLRAAALALEHDLLSHCMFLNHEAIEKVLKAIWIDEKGEAAEKTHNLPYLAKELGLPLSGEQMEFLRKLYWELIPSRYPEGPEPDRETVTWYHEQAKGLFSWLRQMLK